MAEISVDGTSSVLHHVAQGYVERFLSERIAANLDVLADPCAMRVFLVGGAYQFRTAAHLEKRYFRRYITFVSTRSFQRSQILDGRTHIRGTTKARYLILTLDFVIGQPKLQALLNVLSVNHCYSFL